MKWNSRRVRAWAYTSPADLRKGFDGLSALVSEELRRDPLSGDLFLFVSRNRIRAKVLHWDGTGLCLYAKRLEKGKFACLWTAEDDDAVRLTTTELSLFLEGSKLVGKIKLSPPEMTHFYLAKRSMM
jgi:transposase